MPAIKWSRDERLEFMSEFREQLRERGLKSKLHLGKDLNIVKVFIQQKEGSYDKYGNIGPTGTILRNRDYPYIAPCGRLIHYKPTPEQTRINLILENLLENTEHKVTGYVTY